MLRVVGIALFGVALAVAGVAAVVALRGRAEAGQRATGTQSTPAGQPANSQFKLKDCLGCDFPSQ